MAGLASLATGVTSRGDSQPTVQSAVYLITLNPQTDQPTFAATLQYFPESLSDTKAVNWQTKEIPGASLPLYQWTGSGERTISFTAQFSTDIDYLAPTTKTNAILNNIRERLRNAGQLNYNVDIRSAVVWLRSHMLPTYSSQGFAIPPPKLQLFIPRSGIGLAGGAASLTGSDGPDSIICVMTSCEVTWEKFFVSGAPRLASVNLSFAQVPQYKGQVQFPTGGDAMRNAFVPQSASLVGSNETKFLGYQPEFVEPLGAAGTTL